MKWGFESEVMQRNVVDRSSSVGISFWCIQTWEIDIEWFWLSPTEEKVLRSYYFGSIGS